MMVTLAFNELIQWNYEMQLARFKVIVKSSFLNLQILKIENTESTK